MNAFEKKLDEIGYYPHKAERISVLCAMLTFKCNLRCTHCYIDASPDRTEMMSLETIDKILDVLKKHDQITTIELSGGEPELNPHFRYFLKSAAEFGKIVTIASNLTLFHEPGMEDLPELLAEHKVKVFASLPHYQEDLMDKQRGKGTYKKVISSLKSLNELGYGQEGTGLEIDLEFNTHKLEFMPDPRILEQIFKEKLMEMHGIKFNMLVVLNNCPLGRTGKLMSDDEYDQYMKALEAKFNPDVVKNENLMCKYMIIISPEGKLSDCVFYQELDLPFKDGRATIDDFDYAMMNKREINTHPMCFFCTADSGVTCFQFDGKN